MLAATFSDDGGWLATGSLKSTINLWDVNSQSRDPVWSIPHGHLSQVLSLAFCHEHQLLVSSGADRTIERWDMSTGQKHHPHMLEGHAGRGWDLAVSPDGNCLASASADYTVKLWDLRSGKLLKTLTGHLGEVRCLAFSPNGKILATGGDDLEIKLWNV